ncbi:MAG: tryptophan synthase subunit alpha, partial [Crenarchaeota archaeon]|nr:tryptophan synthase subunit alpha [Thermoproteota archaeon]
TGTTPKKVLEIVKELKNKYDIPIAIMTYYNLLFKMGLEVFFSEAQKCNLDATIIPDLPLEESANYKKAAEKFGIDTIFLVAPSTIENRLNKMIQSSSGFLYLVSHFGVTGTKSEVESSTLDLVKKIKKFTAGKIPLSVGFGVSKPGHVKDIIKAGADGVIVGSAFINIINANLSDHKKMLKDIEETAKNLKQATTKQ